MKHSSSRGEDLVTGGRLACGVLVMGLDTVDELNVSFETENTTAEGVSVFR